jgi:phosphinothricin acetyltransferase
MGAPAFSVRATRPGDLATVEAIYAHHVLTGLGSFEEVPPGAAEIASRWRNVTEAGLPHLVAVAEGTVLGFAYAGPYRLRSAYRFCLEDSVYVAADASGRGIGRALLDAVLVASEAQGCRQMIAAIGDSANAASIGLHRAAGFRHTGTLEAVGFKFGAWRDVVFMQRALGPGGDTLPDPDNVAHSAGFPR